MSPGRRSSDGIEELCIVHIRDELCQTLLERLDVEWVTVLEGEDYMDSPTPENRVSNALYANLPTSSDSPSHQPTIGPMRYRVHSALIYDRCGGCQQRTSCGTTWFLKVQYCRSAMRTRELSPAFCESTRTPLRRDMQSPLDLVSYKPPL